MGQLLYNYKKAVFDEINGAITANTSQYYAFAANPIPYTNAVPVVNTADYASTFTNDWQMLFGKRLTNNDIVPIISNVPWTANTVYNRYDNTVADLSNFYVVAPPSAPGGDHAVYKCIDNANGAPSTYVPDRVQESTFYKSDGYGWRYIYSITDAQYTRFAVSQYVPVFVNTTIVSAAACNMGVDVVAIVNPGQGYQTFFDGTVQSINTSVVQIDANASSVSSYYVNNSIYIYDNSAPSSAQLFSIVDYVSNTVGNWVFVNAAVNTSVVTPGATSYKISPSVVFSTDGSSVPVAYSTVNPFNQSIQDIIVINSGVGVSWANVSIVSNSHFGTGANLYAIVPPPGGHGANPAVELNMAGYSFAFTFNARDQANTLSIDVQYNKIGLLKNPYVLNADSTKGSNVFSTNTFNQMLQANVTGSVVFNVGDRVSGGTSGALGTVAFSNSTVIYLTGDKYFTTGEDIVNANGNLSTTISINTRGSIYTKDALPLYVQNINNVARANGQDEAFKLIITL